MVRVHDGNNAVLFSHEAGVHGESDGTLDGGRLVLVVERFASIHGSTTLRDLQDDWRASNLTKNIYKNIRKRGGGGGGVGGGW